MLFTALLLAGAIEAFFIEPDWIQIRHLSINAPSTLRLVHISDLHYKGDQAYLVRIVNEINRLQPELVCFTGDLVENSQYLEEALKIMECIQAPLYGVPGNHEYWSKAPFAPIEESFRKTGGDWLVDRAAVALQDRVWIMGRSGLDLDTQRTASELAMPGQPPDWTPPAVPAPSTLPARQESAVMPAGAKRILLLHYPVGVERAPDAAYDLILAGHAHGGQIRLPLIGALVLPFAVGRYQFGLYPTPAGPLHVSPGLGTFLLPARFLCRPEITLIEL